MRKWAFALVVMAVGCVGTTNARYTRKAAEVTVDGLVDELLEYTASRDARGIAHMLGSSVGYGGLWFPDTMCRRRLSGAGTIPESGIDELAGCLASLPLTRGTRTHPDPNVVVLTYDPGIEIEALFDPTDGGHLMWLGFAGRRDVKDALPTVTQAALVAHRIDPAPIALDAATRTAIDDEIAGHEAPARAAFAWFKLCVDATGAVSGVHPRMTSSLVAQRAFAAAIEQWRFEPFKLGEQPSPVCAMMFVDDPEGSSQAGAKMPAVVPQAAFDATILAPGSFGPLLEGDHAVIPDPETMTELGKSGAKLRAIVMYCVGPVGLVDGVFLVRSSGVEAYDKRLVDAVGAWRFAPLVTGGEPLRACAHATFIYSQR